MELSCNMADDLLPLYLDGGCSEDSRTALEAHLKTCPACREKLERMRRPVSVSLPGGGEIPALADYGRKLRKHRIQMAAAAVLITLLVSVLLALLYLTVCDMRRQAVPHIYEVEEGTWNLTAAELETAAEEAGQYVLYTNYTQIRVTVQAEGAFQGTVRLWDAGDDGGLIQTAGVSDGQDACTFTNLSAARRYRITCEGLEGAPVIISEGRSVSFWGSLRAVLSGLARSGA